MNANTVLNEEHDTTEKTTDIEEIPETKEATKPEITPGSILSQAREENNLSIGHVADRLCLDIRVIEGLENDNYEKLPSTMFIRGYLRNYAKLLEVPEEPIIEGFDRINKSQKPKTIIATPKITAQKQTTSLDLWPKLVSILLVISLIILMVVWQFYSNTAEETENSVAQVDPTTTEPWANQNVGTPVPTENNINNGTNNATATQIVSQDTTQTGTITEATSNSQTITKEIEETSPVELDHTLTVHFNRRVWMRIKDSDGKQLYEGIGNKDQVLPVKGTPPYKIKVGNNRIDIEYLSETKNIRQFSRDDGYYIIGKKEE